MSRTPQRWHAAAREDGGAGPAEGDAPSGATEGARRHGVGLPDADEADRRRRTIEALRPVERELERAGALLDGFLRRRGVDPDAPPGSPPR